MKILLILIVIFNSIIVYSADTKKEREAFFKAAFRELEIFYQDFKKKYVREKKVDEKLLPIHFPQEIRYALETRSLEELKNLGKDQNAGKKDMELYLGVYFERILSGEITPSFIKTKNKSQMQSFDAKKN